MQQEWFETFFQGLFVELWDRIMTPEITATEVDSLQKAFAAPPGARFADIACGNGRHAIELARRGYLVTAVDLSEEFRAIGKRNAAEAGVSVDWRHGDMRSLDLEPAAFDGAYCMGNSFCYLDYGNVQRFLDAVAGGLRPGGILVIDHGTAAESILPAIVPKRWFLIGDIYMLSESTPIPEESRLDIEYTCMRGSVVEKQMTTSYVMTIAEIKRLLDQAGFENVSMSSGWASEPYKLGFRLILTARRR
jgi:SAM-dependent methyltransferase